MRNNGLLSSLYVAQLQATTTLDEVAQGRLATLIQTWRTRVTEDRESLWPPSSSRL